MAKKNQLSYKEIEEKLKYLKDNAITSDEVGYYILLSFGKSDWDIQRYKDGKGILKTFDGLLIKGLFCYKPATAHTLISQLDSLKHDSQVIKAAPKIVAVSDGERILAYDMREKETYENPLARLYCDFEFFYPLMGIEKVQYVEESPADIKAAEKLAKLHDELRAYNDFDSEDDLHDLNIFITRLLFCFFAEDTGIFEEQLFTSSIERFTKPDGSDISQYLADAFNIMDVKKRATDIPHIITQFPYVNGGLFSKQIQIPKMGAKARQIILECGELDWKNINPDIFGSMIQAVVNPEERATQGMHYTSVPNIMKVINPLFMDDLREEYGNLLRKYQQLKNQKDLSEITHAQFHKQCNTINDNCDKLLLRVSKMKFFDPACGSGNFLIITYKALRLLEIDVLKLKRDCTGVGELSFIGNSCITLKQFYGIELLDFPHEVAMLSLWLAEHQMNRKLNEEFSVNVDALPLHNIDQIICGNACRIDWNTVCPHSPEEEVYVFGNPPYLGYSRQTSTHKEDIMISCKDIDGYGKLDYISCWFIKGIKYIENSISKYAFVTTNSISQGEQVSLLWEYILKGYEISFAYKPFMWKNNAKDNAMVAVTIIGISNAGKCKGKKLYDGNSYKIVSNISPYLVEGKNTFIYPTNKSISGFPEMLKGCSPVDDGNLLFDETEKEELEEQYPQLKPYIKQYIGADEFVNGKVRYCLWFSEQTPESILECVKGRLEKVATFRNNSSKKSTKNFAQTPHLFIERKYFEKKTIVVPQTGSERRIYLPMGIADENTVLSNAVRMINCPGDYLMDLWGIIASLMHMIWVRAVSGRMKTDMQYSNTICYNTFPFPEITEAKKQEIANAAENVLIIRENYPGATLADLYDPDRMPEGLKEAHAKLDDIVESCYPGYPFANDEARLESLFKMYEKMVKENN